MKLRDYIAADLVFVIRGATDKPHFLRELTSLVVQRFPQIDQDLLLARLVEREDQVSTGIGQGVAIPHASVEGLEKTVCVIVQTPDGVDFKSLDSSPVHISFLLLSPPGSTGAHIRLLARIARIVANEEFIFRAATALDAEQLFEFAVEEDGRHV